MCKGALLWVQREPGHTSTCSQRALSPLRGNRHKNKSLQCSVRKQWWALRHGAGFNSVQGQWTEGIGERGQQGRRCPLQSSWQEGSREWWEDILGKRNHLGPVQPGAGKEWGDHELRQCGWGDDRDGFATLKRLSWMPQQFDFISS